MRVIEIPYFEDDGEARDKYLSQLGINYGYLDYKPWRILESVDSLLQPYGLEIIAFDEDDDVFGIGEIQSDFPKL